MHKICIKNGKILTIDVRYNLQKYQKKVWSEDFTERRKKNLDKDWSKTLLI